MLYINNVHVACNAGDLGLIPVLGRSPGEGHGNPLQYSYLENPMDRRAWKATVQGITKSWPQLKRLQHACTHILPGLGDAGGTSFLQMRKLKFWRRSITLAFAR